MAEFRVVIDGLDLDEQSTRELSERIQKAVLDHFGDWSPRGGSDGRMERHDAAAAAVQRSFAWLSVRDWQGGKLAFLNKEQIAAIVSAEQQ